MLTVMDPVVFETHLNPEELRRQFEALRSLLEEEAKTYVLKEGTNGTWRIVSETVTGNHFRAKLIAEFTSRVIKPGTRAVFTLRTLTGETRGWLITPGRIYELVWKPVVRLSNNKEVLLEAFSEEVGDDFPEPQGPEG